MTDPHGDRPIEESLDKEIGLKAVYGFGLGILLLMAVAGAITWWVSVSFRERLEAQDPPAPALVEARWQHEPPGPRLQSLPTAEYDAFRAEQEEILTSYGWVDETGGAVRVPVDRAIDLALEQGLGSAADEPAEKLPMDEVPMETE